MTAYIIDAIRTPRAAAKPDGTFANAQPHELLIALLHAMHDRNECSACANDLIVGCSTQYGAQGANVARLAAMLSASNTETAGITVGRFCCSGLDAIATAAGRIHLGDNLVLAGGVEQLSAVGMFDDKGLWFSDPDIRERTRFVHMGIAADLLAGHYAIQRESADSWAVQSHLRAASAWKDGKYDDQVIEFLGLKKDQTIRELTPEKVALLPSLFEDTPLPAYIAPSIDRANIHTVATSPGIVDGASLVLLASESAVAKYNLAPRARVVAHCSRTCDPTRMLEAHIFAAQDALARLNTKSADIAKWEINESFAASTLHAIQTLKLDPSKVNVWGGALSMGHPLGASGGILIANLVNQLQPGELGVAMIPGGAGVGVATVVERL